MSNRYLKTQKILNNSESYSDIFISKGVKSILQYSSYDFGRLKDVLTTDAESVVHVVQPFEKLYMISQKYYNSPEYGWLICYTNRLGSELFIQPGTPLMIYFPLDTVLGLL